MVMRSCARPGCQVLQFLREARGPARPAARNLATCKQDGMSSRQGQETGRL